MEKFTVGIDVGGTSIKLGFIGTDGKCLLKWTIPTDASAGGQSTLSSIVTSLSDMLDVEAVSTEQLLGIGIGVPGSIDPRDNTVYDANNLGWEDHTDVRQAFSQFNVPITVENDANAAAIGEYWQGAGQADDNMALITLGTGIGAGIILDGQLIRGGSGAAGELGHVVVDPAGSQCTCGNYGCLETIASATGIVRVASNLAKQSGSSIPTDAKEVFELAQQGDPVFNEALDYVSKYLGLALANLTNTLNLESIVIGGGVSQAGQPLLTRLRPMFDQFIFSSNRNVTKLRLGTLGNDAGIIGNAYLSLHA